MKFKSLACVAVFVIVANSQVIHAQSSMSLPTNTTSTSLNWSWKSIKERALIEYRALTGFSAAKEGNKSLSLILKVNPGALFSLSVKGH